MYEFRQLSAEEAGQVYDLIAARIRWMDEMGLDSWNRDDYLNVVPPKKLQKHAVTGELYGFVDENGRIPVGAIISTSDDRWPADVPALYIHTFVSAVDVPNVGSEFLTAVEDLARQQEITRLRLDVYVKSEPMNAYYESRGFQWRGTCTDGPYYGNLREKILDAE